MEEKRLKLKELNKSRLFYKGEENKVYLDALFRYPRAKEEYIKIKKTRKKIEKEIFKLIQEL